MEKLSPSQNLAEEIKKLFGDKAKKVNIPMLYEEEVNDFVMKIEEAHQKAAESNLKFS